VRQLLTLGLAVGAVTAPVGALLLMLALRDRREDRLLGLVAPEIARLRGAVGLEVRCAAFRPAARVVLHTWLCAPEERWSVWLRCAQAVPPGVQVVTEAPLGPGLVGRLVARRSPRWRRRAEREDLTRGDPRESPARTAVNATADDYVAGRRAARGANPLPR
jgi:hypothetical protein